MHTALPSKKIIPLVLILIILIGAVIFFSKDSKTSPEDFLKVADAQYKTQDSDMDGLLDWEEDLWATDPYNADTDKDGTKDGEEIKTNRHPRVAGPDDSISADYKKYLYESYAASGLQDSNSPTSVLEDEIYPALLTAAAKKMDGQELSEEEIAQIFEPVRQEAEAELNFYTLSDISSDASITMEMYMDSIIKTLAIYAQEELKLGSPLTIIADHISNQSAKSSLSKHVDLYTKLTEDLKNIHVPENSIQYHLDLLNGYTTITSSLREIDKTGYNPLTLFVHVNRYKNAEAKTRKTLETLTDLYKSTQ